MRADLPFLPLHCAGGGALYEGRGTYGDVLQYAERLFGRIRTAVAVQAAPTTLKAAFLDPITEDLATDVALELFARSDQDYLAMFTGKQGCAFACYQRDCCRGPGCFSCPGTRMVNQRLFKEMLVASFMSHDFAMDVERVLL